MYERVVNPRARAEFLDKVDLWSVGATFFHVATGRLPFKPFLKRNDRQTMYSTIIIIITVEPQTPEKRHLATRDTFLVPF